jgi:hypothetical protein
MVYKKTDIYSYATIGSSVVNVILLTISQFQKEKKTRSGNLIFDNYIAGSVMISLIPLILILYKIVRDNIRNELIFLKMIF